MKTRVHNNYSQLYDNLLSLVEATEIKTLEGTEDYFIDNANFFCKSFLIITCTYLESYLKEISNVVVNEMNTRLSTSTIPHNLIRWSIDKKDLKDPIKYEALSLNISRKDIDDNISGNIYRTIDFFRKLGMDLMSNAKFLEEKEIIGTTVDKRNNIVHYNDDASDITLVDIKTKITIFKNYISNIDDIVINHIQPCSSNPFDS